jgi:hypothetical protein
MRSDGAEAAAATPPFSTSIFSFVLLKGKKKEQRKRTEPRRASLDGPCCFVGWRRVPTTTTTECLPAFLLPACSSARLCYCLSSSGRASLSFCFCFRAVRRHPPNSIASFFAPRVNSGLTVTGEGELRIALHVLNKIHTHDPAKKGSPFQEMTPARRQRRCCGRERRAFVIIVVGCPPTGRAKPRRASHCHSTYNYGRARDAGRRYTIFIYI